jgi:hypothetical protein
MPRHWEAAGPLPSLRKGRIGLAIEVPRMRLRTCPRLSGLRAGLLLNFQALRLKDRLWRFTG